MTLWNRASARLASLVMILGVVATGCGDGTPTGQDVELGPVYWEYDGAGLDDQSAVILLTGYHYTEEIPETVQDMLVDFVTSGGGLMTTEWMLYYQGDGYYGIVADIAPATSDRDYTYGAETYTRDAATHPIARDLPATFLVPDDGWSMGFTTADPEPAKQATVVFSGSESGDAVVSGRHGEGRTVHWNMAGEYNGEDIWSPEVRQLLVNIARFISGET